MRFAQTDHFPGLGAGFGAVLVQKHLVTDDVAKFYVLSHIFTVLDHIYAAHKY